MAVIPYPSLDSGYIYDPGKKLDALMSDFYEAEHAQSYLFRGSITSLPYILQQYPDNSDEVINKIRTYLRAYLLKYFDDVIVETSEDGGVSATSYNIRLYIKVYQGIQTVELYNRLKISGTKLEESLKVRQ